MEFNDEERKIILQYNKTLLDDPFECINEGLRNFYFQDPNSDEFERAMYDYAKRVLIEVANKRGLEIGRNETIDIDKNVEGTDGLDIAQCRDIRSLTQCIQGKVDNMNAKEISDLLSNFEAMYDRLIDFMRNYIPRIINSFYDLSQEIVDNPNKDFEQDNCDDLEIDDYDIFVNEEDFDWDLSDEFGTEFEDYDYGEKEEITDEKLLDFIKFLNSYSEIKIYKDNMQEILDKLSEIAKQRKLQEFYSDSDFSEKFSTIMEHDRTRHTYLFHGTQGLDSAKSIMREGLGMMRENLSSTAYQELTMDEVLLYHRGGFMAQIGDDAVIIIDEPKDEQGNPINIVHRTDDDVKISFVPSGLQGLDGKPQYMVDLKYIVGYIDKKNRKIVYNPKYYDYEKSVSNKSPLAQREEELSRLEAEAEELSKLENELMR